MNYVLFLIKHYLKIFELAYYLSNILLVFIAFRALDQIKVAQQQNKLSEYQIDEMKKDNKIRLDREKYYLTTQQIDIFWKDIYRIKENYHLIDLHQVAYIENDLDPQLLQSLSIPDNMIDKIKNLPFGDFVDIFMRLNNIELFSITFIKELADEKLAYYTVGKKFCELIKKFYYIICWYSRNDTNRFNNLIKLYSIWHTKFNPKKNSSI